MVEDEKILLALKSLSALVLSLESRSKRLALQLRNDSGKLLFSLRTQDILLFPSKLEKALHEELTAILKEIKMRKPKNERKDLTIRLLTIVTRQLIRQTSFIRFSKTMYGDRNIEQEFFHQLVIQNENCSRQDADAIWNYWSTEMFKQPMQNFHHSLQEILDKLSQPKLPLKTSFIDENPFELGIASDDEERVTKFYKALKKEGFMQGGNLKAFLDIFKGERVSGKIGFNLEFKRKCHTYYFFVALAEKQRSIIFPSNREYQGNRRYKIVPWKFLNFYFTNWGDPLINISTHADKRLPDYLKDIIKILRPDK